MNTQRNAEQLLVLHTACVFVYYASGVKRVLNGTRFASIAIKYMYLVRKRTLPCPLWLQINSLLPKCLIYFWLHCSVKHVRMNHWMKKHSWSESLSSNLYLIQYYSLLNFKSLKSHNILPRHDCQCICVVSSASRQLCADIDLRVGMAKHLFER